MTARASGLLAVVALASIVAHVILKYLTTVAGAADLPLLALLLVGGVPLVLRLLWRALHGELASDHLAGVSIIASALLGEYLAGAIVVLMLSGGETLEQFAAADATAVRRALVKRAPTLAHRRRGSVVENVPAAEVFVGDEVLLLPHEICPVDGEVLYGHGSMDESYLTGEPFRIAKCPGANVLSGAVNGDVPLTVRATRVAGDSRYARIVQVTQGAEQRRPTLRRIADRLGGWFTPLAIAFASGAWWWTGNPIRFLSIVVVATPCPLLIAIPLAIIGSISAAARRGLIIKDPEALEQLTQCRTMILDKTGTLTYSRPSLSDEVYAPPFVRGAVLPIVAAIETYSRHPLAGAVVEAATNARYLLPSVDWIREEQGVGLHAQVGRSKVLVTNRTYAASRFDLPASLAIGLECIVVIDDMYAATFRFHDGPRLESRGFAGHLGPKHRLTRVLLVSGDPAVEVRHLADSVGIAQIHAEASPEQKVAIVRRETERAKTVFVGDGINDAPALLAATVGIAFGQHRDVTSEAARVVISDSSLSRVDELIHLSYRLRRVALQSAVGGMLLSGLGMILAAAGLLTPVAGAVAQEVIDLLAVLNALRMARQPSRLTDFGAGPARPWPQSPSDSQRTP